MAIGAPDNKQVLDTVLATTVVRLRESFDAVERLAARFAGRDDASIESLGYTADEVDTARAAVLALEQLRLVAYGQATVANADNFFFNADRLTGWQ